MKKLFIFALTLAASNAFALGPITAPRTLETAIAVSDTAKINSYLVSLIEEYEGIKEGNDLTVYLASNEKACNVTQNSMTCGVTYNADRWNGSLYAAFTVKNGMVVEMTAASFNGNY